MSGSSGYNAQSHGQNPYGGNASHGLPPQQPYSNATNVPYQQPSTFPPQTFGAQSNYPTSYGNQAPKQEPPFRQVLIFLGIYSMNDSYRMNVF